MTETQDPAAMDRKAKIRRHVFDAVDFENGELEMTSSIYEGFSTAIMVKGQPRTVALCREYSDAVQLMALIERAKAAAPPHSHREEIGWLVESDENGPLYHLASGSTRDAAQALRFCRQSDAEAFIRAHGPNHYSSTLTAPWKAVEHRWG